MTQASASQTVSQVTDSATPTEAQFWEQAVLTVLPQALKSLGTEVNPGYLAAAAASIANATLDERKKRFGDGLLSAGRYGVL